MGFETDVANADAMNYPETIVVYNGTGASAEAGQIAQVLGASTVKNDGTYSFDGDFLVVIGEDWK